MTHARLWIAAIIIACIIVIGFILSVPHTRDVAVPAVSGTEATTTPSVTLRDTYKKGVHTITGSVEAPNACTTVTADATVNATNASSTESILVSLTMPVDTGVCLQLPTSIPFSATVSATANLPITVLVNDVEASTTLL